MIDLIIHREPEFTGYFFGKSGILGTRAGKPVLPGAKNAAGRNVGKLTEIRRMAGRRTTRAEKQRKKENAPASCGSRITKTQVSRTWRRIVLGIACQAPAHHRGNPGTSRPGSPALLLNSPGAVQGLEMQSFNVVIQTINEDIHHTREIVFILRMV